MKKIKYSVLTFIFGNYEKLHDILDVQPDTEYICITDNKNLKSNTWKIIYDEINPNYTPFRKVIEVRYNPFKYVNTDICLIIDGSIQLLKMPYKLLNYFNDNNFDLCALTHPERNNLIDELNIWKKYRNLSDIDYITCKTFLRNINYDEKYLGLYQVGILLIKKTKVSNSFFKQCLSIINSCASINTTFRVDQILFSAIIHKFFKNKINFLLLSEKELRCNYFRYYMHNSNNHQLYEKINLSSIDYVYSFNKKQESVYIDNLNNFNDITVAICNFNTTELTNNVIDDIIKYSKFKKIIILDNSNKQPFTLRKKFQYYNIKIINNTTQKYIKFDKLLNLYNLSKLCAINNYASLKHTMSIQFLLNICVTKYLLLCDSDIIFKKNIDFINDNFITISDIEYSGIASQNMNINFGKTRFTPFLQFFNIDLINKYRIKYFDINRIHGINNGMQYDTGASFYEDIVTNNIPYKQIKNENYITHLGHMSWK